MAINKASVTKTNNLINTAAILSSALQAQTELLNFSFKYLAEKGEKFKYTIKDGDYFCQLKGRMKEVSKMTVNDFRSKYSPALKNHLIRFHETSESSFGIIGEEQLVTEPFQFSIDRTNYGRVHGFILKNTFYIVWLDPSHELYPGEN